MSHDEPLALAINSGMNGDTMTAFALNENPAISHEQPSWREGNAEPNDYNDDAAATVEERGDHPLDVRPAKLPQDLGLIDDIRDLAATTTLAPDAFCLQAGLSLVSLALLRNARVRLSLGNGAPIHSNLYAVLLAMSSFYGKSTILQLVRQTIRKAQLPHLLLPNQMSPEGLVTHLSQQPEGILINDEIGRIFGSDKAKGGYQANLKSDLTDYYDGNDITRVLRSGTIKVENPFVCILGATVPEEFFDKVSAYDWRNGFLARFLFVQPQGKPNLNTPVGLYDESHAQSHSAIAQRIQALTTQPHKDFVFVGDAFARWNDWQLESRRKTHAYGDNIVSPIVTRYNVAALKFAMMVSAARGTWGEITAPAMDAGIALADWYKANAYEVLRQSHNAGISGGKMQRVLRAMETLYAKAEKDTAYAIDKEPPAGVTARAIANAVRMTSSDILPALDKLVEIGAAEATDTGKTILYHSFGKPLPVKSWR